MKSETLINFRIYGGRPRKGAWIEISSQLFGRKRPWGRPRKGAWIEMARSIWGSSGAVVAPARGRGLKYLEKAHHRGANLSPPQGGVD